MTREKLLDRSRYAFPTFEAAQAVCLDDNADVSDQMAMLVNWNMFFSKDSIDDLGSIGLGQVWVTNEVNEGVFPVQDANTLQIKDSANAENGSVEIRPGTTIDQAPVMQDSDSTVVREQSAKDVLPHLGWKLAKSSHRSNRIFGTGQRIRWRGKCIKCAVARFLEAVIVVALPGQSNERVDSPPLANPLVVGRGTLALVARVVGIDQGVDTAVHWRGHLELYSPLL